MTDGIGPALTRRGFLGATLATGAAALLAGCGASEPQSGSGGTGSTGSAGGSAVPSGAPKRGGKLRIAATSGAGTALDPHQVNATSGVKAALYDALVEFDSKMNLVNGLAEVFEPADKDVTTWTIRVRDGVEWHSGKTLGADDVEYTIRRILDPKQPQAAAALLGAIDPAGITKLDKRTLRLKLKSPNSQLRWGFTPSFTAIVPVDFDPKNPVGTGPFKHGSFTPQQRWDGTRFDNYWRVDGGVPLDAVEFLGFANSGAALNALLAGQVDAVPNVYPAQLQRVQGRSDLIRLESESGLTIHDTMNCRKGQQFEDPRVRKAFKLMFDRQQLVNTVYSGHGAIGNDVGCFPQWDPSTAPDLPEPVFDVDQAKSLLKAAGQEGMTVKLRVGNAVSGMQESAQVLQAQAKAAGVTVELDVVADPAQFYTDAYFSAQFQIDWHSTGAMYGSAYYYWLSKSGYNAAGYHNPQVDQLFDKAITQTGDDYDKTMQDMSRIIADEGPWLVWGRQNVIDLHTDKVTGAVPDASGNGFAGNKLWNLAIA